jgi:DNA-binding response OmpR family regulator
MTHRVLVIEDEAILAKNIRQYLELHEYEVRIAGTAKNGMLQFEEYRPDAVVLDIQLPDGDGREILSGIRQISQDVGVVIITAFGNVQLAIDAMTSGADNYVEKPVALSTLKLLIEKSIAR